MTTTSVSGHVRFEAPQKLHPADPRHPKIGNDQLGGGRFQLLQPLLCRGHSAHLVSLLLEHRDQRPANIDLVFHDEDVGTWLHEVTARGLRLFDCDRERQHHGGAVPGVLDTWNGSTMIFHDAIGDGEAQPGSAGLRRIERFKYPRESSFLMPIPVSFTEIVQPVRAVGRDVFSAAMRQSPPFGMA